VPGVRGQEANVAQGVDFQALRLFKVFCPPRRVRKTTPRMRRNKGRNEEEEPQGYKSNPALHQPRVPRVANVAQGFPRPRADYSRVFKWRSAPRSGRGAAQALRLFNVFCLSPNPGANVAEQRPPGTYDNERSGRTAGLQIEPCATCHGPQRKTPLARAGVHGKCSARLVVQAPSLCSGQALRLFQALQI